MLHFDAILVGCFQTTTLQQFVSSSLGREDSKDRLELMRTVRKLLSMTKVVLLPDKVPMQTDG